VLFPYACTTVFFFPFYFILPRGHSLVRYIMTRQDYMTSSLRHGRWKLVNFFFGGGRLLRPLGFLCLLEFAVWHWNGSIWRLVQGSSLDVGGMAMLNVDEDGIFDDSCGVCFLLPYAIGGRDSTT
jgi:hypothetical protein